MLKILVIEDEELVRQSLLELLEAEKFNPIGAENGAEGVQIALSEKPDIILCDVEMPELDGYEVLKTLHQNQPTATIPFIFLTSRTTKQDFRLGMELGADDYLTKPFTKAELLKAIATRLEKQAALRQSLIQALPQTEAALNQVKPKQGNSINSEQQELEILLRRALVQGEFQIYYQPQVILTTGQIKGAEALLRWQNPVKGMISPGQFIYLAEETGLIIPIGEWVLQTAVTQAAKWIKAGCFNFQIAVNLSSYQLSNPLLSQQIKQILESTGVEPTNLELEITESAVLENTPIVNATLKELKALGIHIAIDDFGTGYASLGYLKQLPVDTLKIDRCFVNNITEDAQNAAITTAIIELGHKLDLMVIAEGVETTAELNFLYQRKCDFIQGYLFSRPLPAPDFENLLVADKRLSVPSSMVTSSRMISQGNQETILVVDDEQEYQIILAMYLESAGYRVECCSSGAEALAIFAARTPDLVISDVTMPQMDGFEFCRHLRSSHLGHLVPFIFVSAKTELDAIIEGYSLGADDYLIKPFQPEEILIKVKAQLQRSHRIHTQIVRLLQHSSILSPPGLPASPPSLQPVTKPAPLPLTRAEERVFWEVIQGYTNKEIGDRLFISTRTVQAQLSSIFRKLAIKNRVQLIRFANEQGYQPPTGKEGSGKI